MHKEVPMLRSTRYTPTFDSLEGKTLLSFGVNNPAATVYQQKTSRFHLDGKLNGLPSGTAGPEGYTVSSFPLSGHLASMGNVQGAFFLRYTFIRAGKLPDLSKSTLVLENQTGSVEISLNATASHRYKFTIMSGSGAYTFASETGHLTISANHKSPFFSIKMQS
jgi:hypothetical protein